MKKFASENGPLRRAGGRTVALFVAMVCLFAVMGAATQSAVAATKTFEAEGMQLSTGAGQKFSDGAASGGNYVNVWSNGQLSGTLNVNGQSTLTVRARGEQCQGAPHMQVKVGNTTVLDVDVAATSWTDYKANFSMPAASYPATVAFTNDFATGCDRNLHVDFVRIDTSDVTPPASGSTFEMETATFSPGSGQPNEAAGAVAGQAALVWANGSVSITASTPAGSALVVRAKGDQCHGAPNMVISMDGQQVQSISVPATNFTDYVINRPISAGNHTFSVAFTNDAGDGCDRNLWVDQIRITNSAPTTTTTGAPTTSTTTAPTTTSTTTPAASGSIEAEATTLSPGAGQTFSDATASAKAGLMIWSAGSSTGTIKGAAKSIVVRAKGEQCQGAPQMTVRVDGAVVGTTQAPATAWTDYTFPANLASGNHTVNISFDNDFTGGCDRNLLLDKISLSNSTPTTTTTTLPTTTSTTTVPGGNGKWSKYKGFNFMGWHSNSYVGSGADQSFAQMASTGANAASINTIWYQHSGDANYMFRDGTYTATDEAMLAGIRRAESAGMATMIRPMVNTYGNSVWRGNFQPSNPNEWFYNYRQMMNHYATMAQANGVEILDIGSEFNSLQGYDAQWRQVVAEARARFNGTITYSANHDSFNVRWFDAVDVIGIDAYFPLSTGSTPSTSEVAARWSNFNGRNVKAEITAVRNRYNKPVIFTEVGYRSGTNTLTQPWETGGAYSPEEQQRALQGTFVAWDGLPWFQGMFLWQWNANPSAGGPGDTDHTPQRKPAEQTVRDRFAAK